MQTVTIHNGSYRNEPINGTFEVIRPWKDGAKGGFITVLLGGMPCRVRCELENIALAGEPLMAFGNTRQDGAEPGALPVDYERLVRENETEDQAIDRIRRTFEIAHEATLNAAYGAVRGMIISGPPGIGKSHGVEEALKQANMMWRMAHTVVDGDMYTIVKGYVTPISLYQIMYNNRDKGRVLVFDDCDIVLNDDTSLNLLKAALDTSKRRTISWGSESRSLKDAEIPNQFDFEGSVIFLTNLNFDRARGKLEPHLKALKSRCLYMNMDIDNQKDMLRRIRQVTADGMLRDYKLDESEVEEVISFVEDYAADLIELSLRTVIKVATLRESNPRHWQEFAVNLVMKPGAKWKMRAKALNLISDQEAAPQEIDLEGEVDTAE